MPIFKKENNSYLKFFVLYVSFFSAAAFHGIFLPLYLDYLKYNKTLIGIILGTGYFITIFSQPLWGIICDRSKFKNIILSLLLICSSVAFVLIPLNNNFYYLLIIITLFAFFERSIRPISDTITLEYIENSNGKFNHVILAGVIGYAIISIFAGSLLKSNIYNLFIFYFLFNILALLISFKLPKIEGHQVKGSKTFVLNVLKNKELTLLLTFCLLIHMTNGYFNSFFAIYFKQNGADYILLGIATFIATLSELIYLLFADKILNKIGTKVTVLCSGLLTGLRCILLHYFSNIYLILMTQVLHGFTFTVLILSLSTYINKNVLKEYKAFGQTLNILIGIGVAPMIGTFIGGKLSDTLGIKQVFLLNFVFVILSVIVFTFLLSFSNIKKNLSLGDSK